MVGKIGIINNVCDIWFVGIDGENVVMVWLGKDNNVDMYLMGLSGVLYVYKEYICCVLLLKFSLLKVKDI